MADMARTRPLLVKRDKPRFDSREKNVGWYQKAWFYSFLRESAWREPHSNNTVGWFHAIWPQKGEMDIPDQIKKKDAYNEIRLLGVDVGGGGAEESLSVGYPGRACEALFIK